jgi:hypothetical protein
VIRDREDATGDGQTHGRWPHGGASLPWL